ncbi:uncharacterized protein LOC133317352 [Gastrolobium bilobum]|uniref:uncharacterized protein LOC133317352 n=1 Tax=Gastrolobium bilobum TaxID=150636 RepID=UPI002AB19D9C|nr:uncharacterized protein LOC133317352 [Gastrolobium bilobum]
MRKEKSPGVKILWIWTFGTAAILVANVMRTRIRDLQAVMNAEQQQQQQHDAANTDSPLVDTLTSDPTISEDKD